MKLASTLLFLILISIQGISASAMSIIRINEPSTTIEDNDERGDTHIHEYADCHDSFTSQINKSCCDDENKAPCFECCVVLSIHHHAVSICPLKGYNEAIELRL